MRIPCAAPLPVPTIMAVGVASPKAHGHEITKTETAYINDVPTLLEIIIQTIKVASAMPITTGTNMPLILSANFSMGALVLVASSTKRTILASVVSEPTRSARMVNQPD